MSELEQDLRTIFSLLGKHGLGISADSHDAAWLSIYKIEGIYSTSKKAWSYEEDTELEVSRMSSTELGTLVNELVTELGESQ